MVCFRMPAAVDVREARSSDLSRIREIYNQGIADRIATLDEEEKSDGDISDWWAAHGADLEARWNAWRGN